MHTANQIRNYEGRVLPARPRDHDAIGAAPAPTSGIFMSPNRNGPENCKDIQSRNGQPFELVAEIWDDDLTDTPIAALIRFPDGLEIQAYEEEIGWGECTVGGKAWPPQA